MPAPKGSPRSRRPKEKKTPTDPQPTGLTDPRTEVGPGKIDADSGGGNASGSPDADTADRAGNVINEGEIEEDRVKLFPDAPQNDDR